MSNYTINKGFNRGVHKVEADKYELVGGYFTFTLAAGNQKVFSIAEKEVVTITMEDPQRPGQ